MFLFLSLKINIKSFWQHVSIQLLLHFLCTFLPTPHLNPAKIKTAPLRSLRNSHCPSVNSLASSYWYFKCLMQLITFSWLKHFNLPSTTQCSTELLSVSSAGASHTLSKCWSAMGFRILTSSSYTFISYRSSSVTALNNISTRLPRFISSVWVAFTLGPYCETKIQVPSCSPAMLSGFKAWDPTLFLLIPMEGLWTWYSLTVGPAYLPGYLNVLEGRGGSGEGGCAVIHSPVLLNVVRMSPATPLRKSRRLPPCSQRQSHDWQTSCGLDKVLPLVLQIRNFIFSESKLIFLGQATNLSDVSKPGTILLTYIQR